jgi:hypothetical protein
MVYSRERVLCCERSKLDLAYFQDQTTPPTIHRFVLLSLIPPAIRIGAAIVQGGRKGLNLKTARLE